MRRTWAVVKREFLEIVRTRLFVLGTLFGPLLILAMLLVPTLVSDSDGVSRIALVDADGEGAAAARVAALLGADPAGPEFAAEIEVVGARDAEALRAALDARVESGALDGYLWLPAGLAGGDTARYRGRDATKTSHMRSLRRAVTAAVQQERLAELGVDPETLLGALESVPFRSIKEGSGSVSGSPLPAIVLAVMMSLLAWFSIVNSGNTVVRSVREERRDKVVEIVLSSLPARSLLLGKIVGVWAASSLQGLVWLAIGAAGVSSRGLLSERMGLDASLIPTVAPEVGVVVVVFFLGGYFLFASLAAALTALVLSDQEASQIPTLVQWIPLPAWLLISKIINDPDGPVAVVGSMIPFFAPILMPARAALTGVPLVQVVVAALLLFAGGWVCVVLAGKLYRITIMATGSRLTPRAVLRLLRSA